MLHKSRSTPHWILLHWAFYSLGNLDLVGNKSVVKMDFNPWVTPIADQLQVGISHVMDYMRTETYK